MKDNKYNSKPYGKKSYSHKIDILGDDVPTLFKAKCDNCGKFCEVPFKPSNGKPVYCRDCFASMRDGADRRQSNRSSFDSKQMFKATCDSCGKICEVPFKPSSNKPIYCSDCFRKTGDGNRTRQSSDTQPLERQLSIINTKLDKLLQILTSQEN